MSHSGNAVSAQAAAAEPIDWAYLDKATLGDQGLAREVLDLFIGQADAFVIEIERQPQDRAALLHRLKGAARAIGARPVADQAQILERHIAAGADPAAATAMLLDRIAAARKAIRSDIEGAMTGVGASAGAAQVDPL